jgi:hypothetical protein
MQQKQYNRLIEVGSIVVGFAAIIGLMALVYTGRTTLDVALPVILGILAGLGAFESGRRKGKRGSAGVDPGEVLNRLDDVVDLIDSRPATPGETAGPTPSDQTTHESQPAESTLSTTPPSAQPTTPDTRIETASYGTLRSVASAVGVTPSRNPTKEGLRAALREADAATVTNAFDLEESDQSE